MGNLTVAMIYDFGCQQLVRNLDVDSETQMIQDLTGSCVMILEGSIAQGEEDNYGNFDVMDTAGEHLKKNHSHFHRTHKF